MKAGTKEYFQHNNRKNRMNKQANYMLYQARSSAKKRGIECTLTIEDIIIPERCPYFGIKLTRSIGKGLQPNTPSIDRINNDKGYTRGNIRVISLRANRAKGNLSNAELITFARAVFRLH